MTNKGIGTSIIYGCINPSFFHNTRLLQLTSTQIQIVSYAMQGTEYCASKRTGIFNLSTAVFPRNLSIDEVQDQLGRTDSEISLKLRNSLTPVTDEEREHWRGNLNKYYSDVLEYDPETDMVFAKLAFQYCGVTYLNTSKKIIEAIHAEYKQTKHVVPERWWAEFAVINSRYIREAWQEVSTPKTKFSIGSDGKPKEEKVIHKNINALKKTFDYLFELEKQYNLSAKKIAPEKLKKLKDYLEEK